LPSLFNVVSGTTTLSVATGNNRLDSTSGALTRTYQYDLAGNVTSDGTSTFAYNDAGRMSSATKSAVTTSYQVNALGQRVKKSNAAGTTYFVYDESGHLVGEYDSSGALIEETIWLNDIPVATLRPKLGGGIDLFYVHTDHLNTPRRITQPAN